MIVEIISIGDELLIGQVINTNAAWLGEQLGRAGAAVRFITIVGDHGDDIRASLQQALHRADFVIATGGLGPTHDDITKKVTMDFFEAGPLVMNAEVLAHVKNLFQRRKLTFVASNEGQALVPARAQVLWNAVGTAPGLLFEKDGKACAVLPGIPAEMKSITVNSLLPLLRERAGGTIIRHRTIRTIGIAESILAEKLAPISELEQYGKIAFLPNYRGLNLRISAAGPDRDEVDARIRTAEEIILAKASKYVYGFDQDTLEEVVGRLLRQRKETVAVAESCTGGLVAHRLTNVSGSSEYFERGFVTYSNAAKIEHLGVDREIVEKFGAVSEPCGQAMAAGVRKVSSTTYGLSVTGIAGPSGGSEEKPVGTVWVGLATPQQVTARHFLFIKDRLVNKERFSQMALEMLYRVLREAGV